MKRLYAIATILFFAVTNLNTATAQNNAIEREIMDVTNDIRGRIEGSVEWDVTKDFSLDAGVETRLNNNIGSLDRIHTFVGATYEIGKHFKIGGEYILINLYDYKHKGWDSNRHRANFNVEGEVKFGDVELSLRERVQTTFRTGSVKLYEKANPEAILRSRIMATYKIRHSRWSPYLLFELHYALNTPKPTNDFRYYDGETFQYITRYRGGVGTKYRIDRNHRLDFYYYIDYDRSYDIDYRKEGGIKPVKLEREIRHIFGVSYKFKL